MKQYCIYLRKSRTDLEAEARGEGETLARHETSLLELAKRLKINVTEIYREIVSGETIDDRPVMQHVLNEVEQEIWTGVLVMEVERLARGDTKDQGIVAQTFKYSNTKIITPVKTYDPNNEYDEEYFEFGLFMSRREYNTTKRRLQGGRITSVKEGKYVGNKPPYGYVREKLYKQKGYTLRINPEQSEIVKMIFELYTKGESQADGKIERLGASLIVRKLNNLKIPSMKGGVWVPTTIYSILRNPVYIGKIRWNSRPTIKKMVNGQIQKKRPRAKPEEWTLVNGLHEAIIDNETWITAQNYLSSNTPTPVPSDKSIKNPIAGLIVCGFCGRRMVRRPYSDKNPDTLMCASTACKNISSQLSYVEDRLIQLLRGWLDKYKLDLATITNSNLQSSVQINVIKKSVKKLDDELKNLEKQTNNIHDLLEQGVYTVEKFLERSRNLTNRIDEINSERKLLVEDIKQQSYREENQKVIIPKVEKIIELYDVIDDPVIKNELLIEVIEKAVYTKKVNGRWHNKPDDFELILYPKLPK